MRHAAPARYSPATVIALLLFAGGLMLSVCAVRLAVAGVPLRVALMMGCMGWLALTFPDKLAVGARKTWRATWIILLFALLGIIVSIMAGTPPGDIVQQLIEIHLQGIVGLILGATLIEIAGPAPVLGSFLLAWGISAVFAIGQALHINFAWSVRAMIGGLMHDPAVTQIAYVTRYRALGLSYTPVHLATQSCLAFAGIFAYRLWITRGEAIRRLDWPTVTALLGVMFVCAASGNRSPLLGCVFFALIYAALAARRTLVVALPVVMLLGIAAVPMMSMLSSANVRVASTDDGSAEGRATQRYYGMRLLMDQPLGYGLSFESTEHWARYADEVKYMANPMTIRNFALHNYFLMMLNKYGVLVLALALLLLPRSLAQLYCWIGFLPYIVHIFYHNDGPLQGDFFIWYLLPLCAIATRSIPTAPAKPSYLRPWTRSYRLQQMEAARQR